MTRPARPGESKQRSLTFEADAAFYERELVAWLLHQSEGVGEIGELAWTEFGDSRLGQVYEAVRHVTPCETDALIFRVIHDLTDRGELDQTGGPFFIAGLWDEDPLVWKPAEHSQKIRVFSRRREQQHLIETMPDLGPDRVALERVHDLQQQIDQLHAETRTNYDDVIFIGTRTRELRKRPTPLSPLPGLLDAHAGVHLCQGKAVSGKSNLCLWLALHWCQNLDPWEGAQRLPGTRALIISNDHGSAASIESVIARLSESSPESDTDEWTDRLGIIGRDPELGDRARRILRLDDQGLEELQRLLQQARDGDDPYGLVVIDCLTSVKPLDIDQNDNDLMYGWIQDLQRLAEECDVHIILIHHTGHEDRANPVGAGRGASAIADAASVLWKLTRKAGEPRIDLTVAGNEIANQTFAFSVAAEDDPSGWILYWKLIDEVRENDPHQILEPCVEYTTTQLAERLGGGGAKKSLAGRLRREWEKQGLIEVWDGPRNAKMLRIKEQS